MIALVVALGLAVLLVVFRPLLVPIEAVAIDPISTAAASGVVTAVSQHGRGASPIGVDASGGGE